MEIVKCFLFGHRDGHRYGYLKQIGRSMGCLSSSVRARNGTARAGSW
jgi:hypothetical protein